MKPTFFAAGLFVALLACSPALAIPLAFEYFDYPVDSPGLDGKTGGFGWTNAWVSGANPLSVAPDGASLDSPAYPFSPVGNRAYSPSSDQGGGAGIAVRQFTGFDASQDGNVFYASWLMQKVTSPPGATGGANVEVNFGPASSTQAIRIGISSPNTLLVAGTSLGNQFFDELPVGETFFTVMKLTASSVPSSDLVQVAVFDSNASVPATEPAWTIQRNDYNLSSIDSVRLWIGANAEGAIDEIRLGSTWEDVTFFDPNFIQGDFDGINGLDINDYEILRDNLFTGATYQQGDFDGNGEVDLRDFIGFRETWNAEGLGAFPGAVPEPSTFALFALGGLLGGGYYRRHGRR